MNFMNLGFKYLYLLIENKISFLFVSRCWLVLRVYLI